MVLYSCPRCGYSSDHIGNLHTHFERKKPCKPKLQDIEFKGLYKVFYAQKAENENDCKKDENTYKMASNSLNNFQCSMCGKAYKHRQSLYNHCKRIHGIDTTLKKDLKEMQKKVDNLVETKPSSQTINNTMNQYNNPIIIVNNFGNENIDYINEDYIANRLKQPKQGINEIIRQIHFNPGRPENHNIKITNKKLPYVSVFKNNTWEFDDKKKVIKQMINKSYGIMDEVYNDKQDVLMPSTRRQYQIFQHKFDEDDSKLKKDLEKSTELQILNEQLK